MKLIENYNEENLFKTKFTGSGIVILILLVLTLLGLGERVLYDLTRNFTGPIGYFGYFNNSQVITIHAIFIILLLIISVIVNYILGRKYGKYALVLIPYLFTSTILAIQLAIQLGVYFTMHHNNLQFYLVLSLLVIVSTYSIFHIQNNYKREDNGRENNVATLLSVVIVVFVLFTILILSFNTEKNKKEIPPSDLNGASYQEQRKDLINSQVTASMDIPKIAFWMGAVNQHWDLDNKKWVVDSEPIGANVDKLSYCKKWYPNTKIVESFGSETLPVYYDGNFQEKGKYNPQIYKCVN